MRNTQAAGADGWRVSELKHLPRDILTLLATCFNEIEKTGTWPSPLQHAFVSLIPKSVSGLAEDLPIS
eukprot:9506064-Karenia_brevis.AAC.1